MTGRDTEIGFTGTGLKYRLQHSWSNGGIGLLPGLKVPVARPGNVNCCKLKIRHFALAYLDWTGYKFK
jgi:hypothetical protein